MSCAFLTLPEGRYYPGDLEELINLQRYRAGRSFFMMENSVVFTLDSEFGLGIPAEPLFRSIHLYWRYFRLLALTDIS